MFCPRCENLLVVRRPSTNLLDRLFCRISIYPFQCQWCGHRFRAKQSKTRVSMDDVKRRKAYRTPVRIPVSFESREGPGEGIISDISASGCVIESKRWLRPGLLLQLQLTAGTDGEPDITIQQLGSVQWVRGDQAGVQFVALTPQRQLRLTRIIARATRMLAGEKDDAQPSLLSAPFAGGWKQTAHQTGNVYVSGFDGLTL